MIVGEVTHDLDAVIPLTLRAVEGPHREVLATIDTGFNRSLMIPPEMVAALRWSWCGRELAILGDGSEVMLDLYEGLVIWAGTERRVSAGVADTPPLVGMELLLNFELRIDVRPGGRVTTAPGASDP